MSGANPSPKLVWDSLIAESQLATELVTSGVRHLCGVPLPSDVFIGTEDDAKFPLHVGLHSLTSGLERLAKLTILLEGRLESGGFPNVRSYSHRLAELYDHARQVSLKHGTDATLTVPFPDTTKGSFGAQLLDFLTDFANGPGRYSYLDTLSHGSRASDPYATWRGLCRSSPPLSDEANRCLWIYRELHTLTYGPGRDDLEVALGPMFEARAVFLPASTATALSVYELVAPVAGTLAQFATHAFYGRRIPEIPLLGEVVVHVTPKPDDFLAWELLHLGDVDVVAETLLERLELQGEDQDLTDDDFTDEHRPH